MLQKSAEAGVIPGGLNPVSFCPRHANLVWRVSNLASRNPGTRAFEGGRAALPSPVGDGRGEGFPGWGVGGSRGHRERRGAGGGRGDGDSGKLQ